MITSIPKPVKLWGRGQLTIPKEVRRAMQLDDETQLSVFVVGRCLILTPKRLLRASLAKDVAKAMAADGISLDDVLGELKAERTRYNRAAYGQ